MHPLRQARFVAAALTISLAQLTPAFILAAPVAASPVAAVSGTASAASCGPADVGILARGGIADSSGVIREKDTGQAADPMPASARGKAPADFSATVDVYFHVITDGTEGALTDAQIASQIRVLNVTYSGGEGGADSGFAFHLAGITRTDNARWYLVNSTGSEHGNMGRFRCHCHLYSDVCRSPR